MKRFKKIIRYTLLTLLILLCSGIIFRGFFYRQLFSYKSIGQRITYVATDKELLAFIDKETITFKPDNVKDIIEMSLKLTSARLEFIEAKNDIDPNKLIRTAHAHCIGYSAFFTTICNYLLYKYGFSTQWVSKPIIGKIYFCGINIHQFTNTAFFKDHDFNSIENMQTGEKYYTDPTLNDYFYIDYVTGK